MGSVCCFEIADTVLTAGCNAFVEYGGKGESDVLAPKKLMWVAVPGEKCKIVWNNVTKESDSTCTKYENDDQFADIECDPNIFNNLQYISTGYCTSQVVGAIFAIIGIGILAFAVIICCGVACFCGIKCLIKKQ